MRVGKRIFPYPVLNSNTQFSNYISSEFKLIVDEDAIEKNDTEIIIKNIRYSLNNESIRKLIKDGLAECVIIVECSSCVFRKVFKIHEEPEDISFEQGEIKGEIDISSYIYLTDDIKDYESNDFEDEYKEYKFNLEKFDIIAADDGIKFYVEIDEDKDDKVSSIFTIVKKEDNSEIMTYNNTVNRIVIQLSPKYYDSYCILKNEVQFNNIFFSMLVIPTLSNCLKELQENIDVEEETSIEEIEDNKKWFRSIRKSYERIKQKQLTVEDFMQLNTLDLAQIVLNNGICTGLSDFERIVNSNLENSLGGDLDE